MMVAVGLGGIAELLSQSQRYTANILRFTGIVLLLYLLAAITFDIGFFDDRLL
jgi:hypothetical protein